MAMSVTAGAALAQSLTPVHGKPVLGLGAFELGPLNYSVEEYFLSGQAASYKPVGELGADGRWSVQEAAHAPFTTRLVIVKPTDAAKFNGTVLVEWLNVSAGADGSPDWNYTHREMIREGYAYVGVSVQKVGIEGNGGMSFPGVAPLKTADPVRYAALSHPGDAFAYDIFTQAARAIRHGGPLGHLKVQRLIGDGESQSAMYLTTYINAIDPLAKAFDGYLVHSRFGGAARFEEGYLRSLQTTKPEPVHFRDDLRVPVMVFISETDLMIPAAGYLAARQPDTRLLRVWEVPGTAHADTYTLAGAAVDSGSEPIATLAKSFDPPANLMGAPLAKPMNSAPQHHYVMQAALAALESWLRTGTAPPHGPRIDVVDGPAPVMAMDANGNATGGIRTPWLDAPTAKLSGLGQSGPGFAVLFGVTEPFDQAKLAQLYPGGRAEYQKEFDASLGSAIKAGFILRRDEAEIRALAAAMYPGP
jgi:hypothetical protein